MTGDELDPKSPYPVDTYVRGELRHEEGRKFSGITSLDFHEYCALLPTERFYEEEARSREFRIPPPSVRLLLRYWPTVMLSLTLLVYLGPPLVSDVQGLWIFLPQLGSAQIGILLILLPTWILLLYTFYKVELISSSQDLLKPVLIYGLIGSQATGTMISIWLVWQADAPSTLPPNVIYVSGFLLTTTIGGILGYDLVVRTESMFGNYHLKNTVTNTEGYLKFLNQLNRRLRATAFGQVPVCYIFGVLFTLHFAGFWYIRQGPQYLNSDIILLGNLFFDLLMMTGIFQFLIIITNLRVLLDEGYEHEGETVSLEYQPFHPDGQGGFRDIGRGSMRVNLLLILGGLYYGYRLFVQGGRAMPEAGFTAMNNLQLIFWAFDFILPIIMYILLTIVWLYSTFWKLHVKMARERERIIIDQQSRHRDSEDNTPYGAVGDEVGYQNLENAPTWPIDRQQFQTLILSNLLPVIAITLNFPA